MIIEINNITECLDYLQDIDLVLFDLDDTITNEIDYIKSGYDAIAKEFPQIKDCSDRLLKAFKKKEKPIDMVFKEEGIFTEENVRRALEVYRSHKPKTKYIPGVEYTLVALREQGKKLGVITDGRVEGQQAKIDVLNLNQYVDKIIITDALGGIEYRKPNPKAYMIMQETFKLSCNRIAYVGDNISKDFIVPEKFGMKSIHFINKQGIYQ